MFREIYLLKEKEFIWEERNYMSPKNKNENLNEKTIDCITNGTKSESNKSEWNDIGKIGKRSCPRCNREIVYRNKDSFCISIKNNSICRSCANTRHIGPFVKNCPVCESEMSYSLFKLLKYSVENNVWCHKCAGKKTIETRIKRKNLYGNRNQSVYSKRKLSLLHKGKNNPFYGKKHTIETRRKLRLNTIKYIEKIKGGKMFPLYNKKSCEYFHNIEKERGWNGYYATKSGEFFIKDLGYWVDYYEPNENVVIEWDEPTHYEIAGELKRKDKERMLEIKNHLKCKFFRFNQKLNELREY